MPSDLRPVLFMLVSTFSLSASGMLAKVLSDVLSIEMLAFLRFLLPATIMLGMLTFTGWVFPTGRTLRPVIIRALCIVGSQICFLTSLSKLSLVESIVLFSTGPLFIPVLEKLIDKTPFNSLTVFNLGLTFVGVVLQAGSPTGIDLRPELLFGLAAGLFNAASQVTMFRGAKSDLPSAAFNGWCFMLAAVILMPVAALNMMQYGFLPDDTAAAQALTFANLNVPQTTLVLLLTLACSTVSTQMFRSKAYRLAKTGSELAPLIFTNLLFAVIWQVWLFDESLAAHKIWGISLIVLATLINTFVPRWLNQRKETSPAHS
ncbi:DMT family transporter [Photobacterium ganghwense]|nr:DMT family transporter [Photobacterium ganghwense]